LEMRPKCQAPVNKSSWWNPEISDFSLSCTSCCIASMQYRYPSESHVSDLAYVWMGNMKTVQCVIEKWLIFYHEAGVLHTDTRLPNHLVFRKDDTIYILTNSMKSLTTSSSKRRKQKKALKSISFLRAILLLLSNLLTSICPSSTIAKTLLWSCWWLPAIDAILWKKLPALIMVDERKR
jgi:hypothetical protein